jgi:hypothetical protein
MVMRERMTQIEPCSKRAVFPKQLCEEYALAW